MNESTNEWENVWQMYNLLMFNVTQDLFLNTT